MYGKLWYDFCKVLLLEHLECIGSICLAAKLVRICFVIINLGLFEKFCYVFIVKSELIELAHIEHILNVRLAFKCTCGLRSLKVLKICSSVRLKLV